MQPVFITGFESSGTTLLRRIVSMHPYFSKDLIHEQKKLLLYKTAQEAENNYYDEHSHIKCGEKIPYLGNCEFIMKYMERWREFWPDSLIFHIIRDNEEVAESCKRRFNRPANIVRQMHADSVRLVDCYINELGNYQIIPFKALTDNPVLWVKAIYHRMGEVPDDDYIHKVITTREPWMHGDKRCCGLRYNDCVGRINHNGP
jgi:hypothetical protein